MKALFVLPELWLEVFQIWLVGVWMAVVFVSVVALQPAAVPLPPQLRVAPLLFLRSPVAETNLVELAPGEYARDHEGDAR